MRAIELDETNNDAYYCIGGVYENAGQLEKAEKFYKKLREKEGESTRVIEALSKLKK